MTIDWLKLRQWWILFVHFFKGFFYGETDDHDDRKWEQFRWILIAIAACNLLTAWNLLSDLSITFSPDKLWFSFTFMLALQMIMSGIFVIISWSNFSLTPRDHENLAHLPVSMLAIVSAKIVVVLSVIIVLSLIHIVCVTPVILNFSLGKIEVSAVRYSWAIFRYFLWGNVWIFFALTSLLGACQCLTRWRFGTWLFHFIQIGGIALFLGVLFYLPRMMVIGANGFADIAETLPLKIPLIFVEKIKIALHMPAVAVVSEESHFLEFSSAGVVFLTLLFFSIIFRRFYTNSYNRMSARSKQNSPFYNWVYCQLIGRLLKNPPERGLFFFMKKTFFRNRYLWVFLILLWAPLFGVFVIRTLFDENVGYLTVFSEGQNTGVLIGIALGFLLVFFSRMIFKQTICSKADWLWYALPSISLGAVFRATMKVIFIYFSPLLWIFMILVYSRYWHLFPMLLFCMGLWPMFIYITFTLFFAYDSIIPFTVFRHQEDEDHSLNTRLLILLFSVVYILVSRWVALRLINVPALLFLFLSSAVFIIGKFRQRLERKAFFSDEISGF